MTPFLPFAISLLGAFLVETDDVPNEGYSGTVSGPRKVTTTVTAPTRFTSSTALTNIVKARESRRPIRKKVLTASGITGQTVPTDPETGSTTDTEDAEEQEVVDPLAELDRKIELELMIESIGDDVIEDMDLGQIDEDLLEAEEGAEAPNEEFGSSYYSARAISPQRLDRMVSDAFGSQDLFDSSTAWGIKRRRNR